MQKQKKHKKISIKLIISYYKNLKGLFALFIITSVLLLSLSVGIPFLTKFVNEKIVLVDDINSRSISALIQFVIITLSLVLVRGMAQFFNYFLTRRIGFRIITNARTKMFEKTHKLKYEYFDKKSSGETGSFIINDTGDLFQFFTKIPEDLIIFLLQVIASIVTTLLLGNWLIMLILILNITIVFLTAYFIIPKVNEKANIAMKNDAKMSSTLARNYDGIREIKSYSSFAYANDDYEKTQKEYYSSQMKSAKYSSSYNATIVSISLFLSQLLVFFSMYMLFVRNDSSIFLTRSSFLALISVVFSVQEPALRLANALSQIPKGLSALNRVEEFLRKEEETNNGIINLTEKIQTIEFIDVSFKYPNRDIYVLKNFNLKINSGEKIALVGQTGIGKSTVLKLLIKGYDIESGQILVNGRSIDEYTLNSLRTSITYIQQNGSIFNDSIRNNILFGNLRADENRLMNAIKQADIHNDIDKFDGGMEFNVGPSGNMISGGQKQRISLARSFIKDSSLVLMDEATSALDNNTQDVVVKSVDNFLKSNNLTSIIVAHRLSSIKDADRVIYLGGMGRVIAQGKFKDLIKISNEFKQFVSNSEEVINE
jgi:ATP-binding cassette subfamily B protein